MPGHPQPPPLCVCLDLGNHQTSRVGRMLDTGWSRTRQGPTQTVGSVPLLGTTRRSDTLLARLAVLLQEIGAFYAALKDHTSKGNTYSVLGAEETAQSASPHGHNRLSHLLSTASGH
ncbi:hypothetical protein WMY93_027378 [Mugilogobius chulae]|uniref:Uncharacterized protein n=1 Tax=Mugilogobius chulae TaxID=88201 RepID=A0AAW0N1M7_9GOBI